MATTSEARALPFFTDLYGSPLEAGFIYIGQPGLDPVAYPAIVTSDVAGSTVVAQPIRTTHGHAAAAGALIHLFCPIPYSITILDSSRRVVYASLNETDPNIITFAQTTVQSAADLAALRARNRNLSNQVWVDGFGMYVYQPNDTTSPETIPTIIVGSDGGRHYLDTQYVLGKVVSASSSLDQTAAGAYLSYNDGTDGAAYITSIQEPLSAGGLVLRTMKNGIEEGRVTIQPNGNLIGGTDVKATFALVSIGGFVALEATQTKGFSLISATAIDTVGITDLMVNGAPLLKAQQLNPNLATNQQTNGVGAVGLGDSSSTTPAQAGTWVKTGTFNNSVVLWVRIA
jgi:hypothetical protein